MATETTAEIEAKLTDAKAAYHNLVTGKMARVVVDQNGERVEFTAANQQRLYLYIQQLEKALQPSSSCYPSPVRFLF